MSPEKALADKSEKGPSQTNRATLLLREMLVQGDLRPGERIREVPLAKQLGVSRIPLHLALERLAHEGLLEIRRTRGFVVQEFSRTDICDAIELRGTLEGAAARLAAERVKDLAELSTLQALSQEMIALVHRRALSLAQFGTYIDLNAKFHAELFNLSRSRILRRAMEQVCSLPFASPSSFLRHQYIAPDSQELFLIAVDQHRGIVEAITAREGMRAETLAREHARVARRNLESALKNLKLVQLVPGGKLIKL